MSEDNLNIYSTDREREDKMQGITKKVGVMRIPVQQIYDRQVARCLSNIHDVYELPDIVIERIKRAIEYTAKDVDKINNKESGNGTRTNYNR